MRHLELGFIGFGLIGGSIARSLKKENLDVYIKVYTRRKNPDLEAGAAEGVIDQLVYKINEQFSTCDVIFLCTPVLKNLEFLSLLKPLVKPSCILTDVGSVKGNICRKAEELGISRQFIGGHPMAGSEKTGYKNSSAELLKNAYYLLTPNKDNSPEDIELMKELVSYTGSDCVVLTSDEHDKITAAISHVPHIIAAILVNMVRRNDNSQENMKAFAAGGFKDITRIASSSPEMWQDICIANGDSIDFFLKYFEEQIEEFRSQIAEGNLEKIKEQFHAASEYRNSLSAKKPNPDHENK